MVSARRQMSDGRNASGSRPGSTATGHPEGVREKGGDGTSTGDGEKRHSNYNYDEAVLKVQEWNEALKCEYSFSAISGSLCHPV
jgi:hypothetical protein